MQRDSEAQKNKKEIKQNKPATLTNVGKERQILAVEPLSSCLKVSACLLLGIWGLNLKGMLRKSSTEHVSECAEVEIMSTLVAYVQTCDAMQHQMS